jgi:type I restriction enzyme S subunit
VDTSHYPVKKLGEIISDLENGWSPQCLGRPAVGDEWGVLKVGAVSFGIFDQEQNKALPEGLIPVMRYEVKLGDMIISRANIAHYVGACALVKETRPKLMLCDKLFRVVWKKQSEIIPEYLDEVMKTPHLRFQIENSLTGSSPTMKNISKPSLLALKLPVPSLEEQKSLVETITAIRLQAAQVRENAVQISDRVKADIEAMILGTNTIDTL